MKATLPSSERKESEPTLGYLSVQPTRPPIPWQRLLESLAIAVVLQGLILITSAGSGAPGRNLRFSLLASAFYWAAAATLLAFRLRKLTVSEGFLLAFGYLGVWQILDVFL